MAVTGSSFSGVDPRREAFGYHALIHVLLMGVSGAFLTGDIFNLYVWFEVMLIASFVLMSLHRTRAQLHAAFTYVGLNLLASAFLLTAIGLLYGQAGTLNFADLARAWPERRTPALDAALSMLFLTAFGIKAGLFPLFFWLPASYHTPPAAVGALLAGLLTKVGVYAMIRVFTLLFPDPGASVYTVILVLSAATMVVACSARSASAISGACCRSTSSATSASPRSGSPCGRPLRWAARSSTCCITCSSSRTCSSSAGCFFGSDERPTCARSAACIGRSRPSRVWRWFRCSRSPACLRCRVSSRSSPWSERRSTSSVLARGGGACREPADGAVDGAAVGRGVLEAGAARRPAQAALGAAMLAPIAFLVGLTLGLTAPRARCSSSRGGPRNNCSSRRLRPRRSGRGGDDVLLGNILLALAWAALQGEFSLANTADRPCPGLLDPARAGRGGVLARLPTSAGCIS